MLFDFALYLAVGTVAGLLAGLLGIGGGLLVVAALSFTLPTLGVPAAQVMHVAVATSLASIVLTALASTRAHWRHGSVLPRTLAWLAPGLVAGGLAGAALASRLPGTALRVGVALFCVFSAWRMAFGAGAATDRDYEEPRSPWLLAAGAGIGALSALVGIGGGTLTVPLLVALKARPVRAVGTSAACGLVIALAGAAGYVRGGHGAHGLPAGSIGYIYLPAALAVALASMLMAPVGVRLAHRLHATQLKRVFAAFLLVVGALIASGR